MYLGSTLYDGIPCQTFFNYQLFENHVVFVMWDWCWVDDGSSSDEELGNDHLEESQSSEEEKLDDDPFPVLPIP